MEDTVLKGSGNKDALENAESIMKRAIETASDFLTSKPLSAELILKQLLKCNPENHQALQLLGLVNHRMGKNSEAVEIFESALEMEPENADNWNNISLAYGGLQQHEKSIECLEKAIRYNPNRYVFYNNIALQYRECNRYDESIASLEKALSIQEEPQIFINLGGVYGEIKDLKLAKECFEKSLVLNPRCSAGHLDMAYTYFLMGDWSMGFKEYQWRFDYHPQLQHYLRNYDADRIWTGQSLDGKRILIYGEQGVGDTLQFCRYCRLLKEQGAYVILHCNNALNNLLERFDGIDETINIDLVHKSDVEFPEYDYQCAIMSLPYLLAVPSISGEPYLEPATTKFKEQIQSKHGNTFNIGVVWAGSPAHPSDNKRSMQLKNFKPLEATEGVQLFSLQMDARKRKYGWQTYGIGEDQLSDFQPGNTQVVDYAEDCDDMQLVDLTQMIQSYDDTATILAGLDLVICCDTSVLHLAGAMGVPCWGLIPYNPDWRWEIDGNTTIWYDSVRLFRQNERDNWPEVFVRVKEALDEKLLA